MQYAMIWLEWLLIAVFFAIFWTSVSCRFWEKKWRLTGSIGSAAIPGAVFIFFSCFALWLRILHVRPAWLFFYCASLILIYLISAIVLIILAHQKIENGPRAKHWPLMKNALIFLLLVSINLLTFYLTERSFTHKLEKRLITLEAVVADLLPEPPPPSQNAALILKKVAPLIEKIDRGFLKTVNEPDFDATSADARNFLSKYKNALDLLHQAANMPFYPVNPDKMWDWRYKSYSAKLLALEARSHSRHGRIDDAMESLITIQRLATCHYRYPDPSSVFYIASGMERSVFRCLENVLYDTLDAKIIISDKKLYDDEPQPEDILHALTGYETITLSDELDYDPTRKYKGNLVVPQESYLLYLFGRPQNWFYRVFFAPSNIEFNNGLMAELRRVAKYDSKDTLKEIRVLIFIPEMNIMDVIGNCGSGGTAILYMWDLQYCIKAYRRLEKLALAMTTYFNDTGMYPDTLEALVPEYIAHIPIDPFDLEGGKMKLKPYGKGVLLYSNGENTRDDGGYVKEKYTSGDEDIVIILGEKRIVKKNGQDMTEQ